MKKLMLFILLMTLIFQNEVYAQISQSRTYTQTVYFSPNGNGFKGDVTFVYAFADCYGAAMAYGYKDLNLDYVIYNGEPFTPQDLELTSFNSYFLGMPSVEVTYRFNGAFIKKSNLSYVQSSYDIGCYGQTNQISTKNIEHTNNLNWLGADFDNVNTSMNGTLGDKIRGLLAQREKEKAYSKKLYEFNSIRATNAEQINKKIALLQEMSVLTKDSKNLDNIKKWNADLLNQLENLKKSSTDQIVLQSTNNSSTSNSNNSSNNSSSSAHNTTTTNKTAQDFRSEANNMVVQYQYQQDYKNYLLKRANEIENQPKRGMTVTGGMDGSGSNNTYLNSINQQKYTYSQKYQNQMATIDAVSSAVNTLGNYFYQRAAEKQRYEEQQQRIKEQKEERDRLFDNEVNRVRSQYRSFVNERSRLFAKRANKTNTFELDGSSFEPIFLYFAYTDKDYTYVKETINKPYSMDFKVNEECIVTFSNLIAVFPMSNGQYPYLDDIHKQIKAKYPHLFSGKYEIKIFPYLRGIETAINALTQDMESSITKHNFAGVKMLEGEQILFLNDQIDASQSIDYWTGEQVKQTKTKKVDYFDTEKQPTKTNKKIDYWETDKKNEPVKTTEPKKETKPKKEINYWDN